MSLELFPGQQENERICLVLRQHWFFLFLRLLIWLIFVSFLFAFDHYLPRFAPGLLEEPGSLYVAIFKNLYLIFLVYALLLLWSLYHLSVEIITDERIVDILQQGIFRSQISELHLTKIEDVTSETAGVFGTFLRFGNVYIQTAGTEEHFIFNNVANPEQVAKLILDLYEKHHQKETRVIEE
jgi:hypothetical protein